MTETTSLNYHPSTQRKRLRIIARIPWTRKIANEDLLNQCQQESMKKIIVQSPRDIVLPQKTHHAIPREAVQWKTEGHRKPRHPKTSWRRTVETEAAAMGQSWGTLKTLAQDRVR
ncbi:endonuclease-reverse transcriptase [Elysia marginata]|uniref:Endonuclease-reverse transcriptase n=1 Tax=Elysia marginata TaxID=1093978 RepID=A0AAV4IJ84_9GAST|nr:endonuclease-reverse transcriptase [Elysia marginata]